jgi:hypothetical protein
VLAPQGEVLALLIEAVSFGIATSSRAKPETAMSG